MIVGDNAVDAAELAARTGWEAKPEGLCKGDVCVPAPGVDLGDGRLDAEVVAQRLGMPLVRDPDHGVAVLGPATVTGRALVSADLPDLVLPQRDGTPFHFSSLRGRKAIMVAWASW